MKQQILITKLQDYFKACTYDGENPQDVDLLGIITNYYKSKEKTSNCSHNHPEVYFEGEFSVLCPVCKIIEANLQNAIFKDIELKTVYAEAEQHRHELEDMTDSFECGQDEIARLSALLQEEKDKNGGIK